MFAPQSYDDTPGQAMLGGMVLLYNLVFIIKGLRQATQSGAEAGAMEEHSLLSSSCAWQLSFLCNPGPNCARLTHQSLIKKMSSQAVVAYTHLISALERQ